VGSETVVLDSERPDSPESSTRRRLLSGVGTVVAVAVAGCSGGNDQLIELQHHSLQEGPFDTYVTGNVRNTRNDPVDVTVSVTFLDGDGAEMGTQSDTEEELPPDESWNFELTYEGENVDDVSDYDIETDAALVSE
jgi:hypothetical protein